MNLETIRERKEFLKDYHSTRTALQIEENNYYLDTFGVPQMKHPQYISRTGTSAWLVDGPASHIVTRNPQAFVKPKKTTQSARDSAFAVNALLNYWAQRILMQIPQPYKEFVKKLLLRGDAWLHPILNERWSKDDILSLPVLFPVPDPLNVYGSPKEEYGIPEYVIVEYQRTPWEVMQKYPGWSNPKNAGIDKEKKNTVDWWEYWDKDVRYFSADDESILKGGIQKNVYGFNPWVHAYSGFGDTSPEGKPEFLAVGRLRRVKDLLLQECAINSDIDSTLHKFARPKVDLILPAGSEFDVGQIQEAYDMGAGAFNVLPLPEGAKFGEDTRILPTQEAFQHFYNIRTRIAQEAPPIMAGLPSGSSGRQEDIVGYHFIRRFDSVIESTEVAFAKALNMGMEILKVVPGFLPITQWLEVDGKKGEKKITEADLDNTTDCKIALKAADPIEDDRKLMAGRALKKEGLIDWETFLIEHAGKTPERANEIIEKTIAEMVILNNPILFQALAEKALENLGMHEQLERLREQTSQQEKSKDKLQKAPVNDGARGGEERQFNAQSPEAREMVDLQLSQRGARRAPL